MAYCFKTPIDVRGIFIIFFGSYHSLKIVFNILPQVLLSKLMTKKLKKIHNINAQKIKVDLYVTFLEQSFL